MCKVNRALTVRGINTLSGKFLCIVGLVEETCCSSSSYRGFKIDLRTYKMPERSTWRGKFRKVRLIEVKYLSLIHISEPTRPY